MESSIDRFDGFPKEELTATLQKVIYELEAAELSHELADSLHQCVYPSSTSISREESLSRLAFLGEVLFQCRSRSFMFHCNFCEKVTARSTTQWSPVTVLPKGNGRFGRLMFLILENGTKIANIFAAREVKRKDEESQQCSE